MYPCWFHPSVKQTLSVVPSFFDSPLAAFDLLLQSLFSYTNSYPYDIGQTIYVYKCYMCALKDQASNY